MENKFLDVYVGSANEKPEVKRLSIDDLIVIGKLVVLDDLSGFVYYVDPQIVAEFIMMFNHECFDGQITVYDMENEKDKREVYEQYCFKQE